MELIFPCKYMSYWNMAIEEFDDLLVKNCHFPPLFYELPKGSKGYRHGTGK
jgi:hypothetical protein